jgi:Oxidoreductase family, NAD-binding Rossmann fold
MSRISFAIVGVGWRADFFLRIAKALPEQFCVVGMVARNADKGGAIEAQWGVPTYRDIDALLGAGKPEFAVVSVPQPAAPGVIRELAGRGVAILTETPAAPTLEGLLDLWRLVENGARVQVAEQYIFQPHHAARLAIIRSGLLGDPSYAHVSACHGYHGTSLIRHFLRIGFENAIVTGRAFEADLVGGPNRSGPPGQEKINRSRQVIAQLDFGAKLGVYDFAGDQYFSWVRARSVLIRGERGEVRNDEVRYLKNFATPVFFPLLRQDKGHDGNHEGYWHKGILAGSDWAYRNPFPNAPLADDEIAVAVALAGMGETARSGKPVYSFAEAAQDQYLSLCIDEAVKTGAAVKTVTQPWAAG